MIHSICFLSYYDDLLPFVAPYLLPATNTLMTCSVYATVAVATNRFFEMTPNMSLVSIPGHAGQGQGYEQPPPPPDPIVVTYES